MPEDFLDFRWISLIAAWIFNYSPTRKLWQGHGRREVFDGKRPGKTAHTTKSVKSGRKPSLCAKQITCYQQRASFESQLIFWNIFFDDYDDVVTTTHYWLLQQHGMQQPRVVRCSWCLSLDWVGRNRIGPHGGDGPSWPVHQPSAAPLRRLVTRVELSSQIAT